MFKTVRGNRKKAQAELNRLLHQQETGCVIEPSQATVGEYLLLQWLPFIATLVAPKTYERYKDIVLNKLIPALGKIKLNELQPLHIQNYYSRELNSGRTNGNGGLSAQTVLHHHRVLRAALRQAVKWQLLHRNPADAVQPPKPERKEMQTLDEAQTVRMLEAAAGTRVHIPLLIAVTTGMRRGEFLAIRWSDIDFQAGIIYVRRSVEQTKDGLRFKPTKTRNGRPIVLLPLAAEALRAHRSAQEERKKLLGKAYQDLDLVCCQEDGSIWPPDNFSAAFKSFARRAKLTGVRLHDMRHTHATQMLGHGIHPKIVSERLGHSTIAITMDIYSHVMPTMQSEAAETMNAALKKAMEASEMQSRV
ncbi:MAG: site-specific integrase [Bryobacteraceae bacterium]